MKTDSVLRQDELHDIRKIRRDFHLPFDSYRSNTEQQRPPKATDSALSGFIEGSEPWDLGCVVLPGALRRSLWVLLPVELLWVVWLATIVTGATACRGPICTVATLDHHAAVLLACGVLCVAGLAALIPPTRGFSECNSIEVIGLVITAAAGLAALLGMAALIIGAMIFLFLIATFVLASTATSRREMDYARARTPFPIAPSRGRNALEARRHGDPD
jgi:hypothetical protein